MSWVNGNPVKPYGHLRYPFGGVGNLGEISTGSAGNIYLPSVSQGWTDFVVFNAASGNVTSEILGDEYTATGALDYQVSGPEGLLGVQASATGEYFTDTAPNTALRPGRADFVVLVQLKHQTGGAVVNYVFDYDHNGIGSQAGVALLMDGTNIDLYVCDGTLNHITRWAHGVNLWEEDAFYTLRYEMDVSETKGTLYVKKEGEGESSVSTVRGGSNLSSLGAVNPAGGLRFLSRENIESAFYLNGPLYTWCMQVGGLSADLDNKP